MIIECCLHIRMTTSNTNDILYLITLLEDINHLHFRYLNLPVIYVAAQEASIRHSEYTDKKKFFMVPLKHNIVLTHTSQFAHNWIIAKKRGVTLNSLVSIHPYKCFNNTCKQNECFVPLLDDFSITSKLTRVSEYNVALGGTVREVKSHILENKNHPACRSVRLFRDLQNVFQNSTN